MYPRFRDRPPQHPSPLCVRDSFWAERQHGWSSLVIGAAQPTPLSAITTSTYAAEERVARVLARLGKPEAAKLIADQLPQTPQIRSGDLGEIYATEWINAHSGYRAPIKRLRLKDHRNMAMRGDDVIGMIHDPATQRLRFLKTEAKSRIDLRAQTLQEARAGLDKDGGLPSAHALSFVCNWGKTWGDG
jgi:hypothetical protein